uniref:Uncharacterized protein n=1 Tax=Physcomitrium patens TaxID=3218 RepID=A0A2K1JMW0_PHYPA|nr:hypothetical protein PHYPA_017709 [Physcomitrium patens]
MPTFRINPIPAQVTVHYGTQSSICNEICEGCEPMVAALANTVMRLVVLAVGCSSFSTSCEEVDRTKWQKFGSQRICFRLLSWPRSCD